jgi:hypothetical protein
MQDAYAGRACPRPRSCLSQHECTHHSCGLSSVGWLQPAAPLLISHGSSPYRMVLANKQAHDLPSIGGEACVVIMGDERGEDTPLDMCAALQQPGQPLLHHRAYPPLRVGIPIR